MKNKSLAELIKRLNNITVEKNKLDIEYNMIVHELWNRIPSLKSDINIQPKDTVDVVIDKLLDGTYRDEIDEYTRIYPLKECCKERLNIVKKKIRVNKIDINGKKVQ